MSQPFGHFLIAHTAMEQVLPEIVQAYPGHVNFGCQGPDMFYTLMAGAYGYADYADVIHSCNTLPFYACLLEKTLEYEPESREHQAARAYAHGFYSHVVADVVYHPFVNRLADNNWAHGIKTKQGTTQHKLVETNIDDCLLGMASVKKDDFLDHLSCYHPGNPLILDPAIAEILYPAFQNAYKDSMDVDTLISNTQLDDLEHTFNKAYRAYLEYHGVAIAAATLGYNLNMALSLRGLASQIVLPGEMGESERWAMNVERKQWSLAPGNENLNYTGDELFRIAVNATVEVVKVGEEFLRSGTTNALAYFASSNHPILVQDHNLDTGLPSNLNEVAENSHTDPNVRFAFETSLLQNNYSRFNY